tara:strand:+ start:8366 stop:9838 length:1473 start_codon:yes stop_codon:yes gene_type:complete
MKKVLILILFFQSITSVNAQTQKGLTLQGQDDGNWFGRSVSMPDSNTVAIGAPNNSTSAWHAGQVQIFSWNGNSWIQKGQNLNGVASNNYFGQWVSMPDSNTIAIAAPYHDTNVTDSGEVSVFSWNGNAWVQKGMSINGTETLDRLGWSISMPDANTIASGVPGPLAGYIKVHSWDGNSWLQKGQNIIGENNPDGTGWAVSMPDSNTIAVSAHTATTYGSNGPNSSAGQVRIFSWNGSTWAQKGSNIDGQSSGDHFGRSVSMPDANTIAIGAPNQDDNGNISGQVKIFQWNGTSWSQKGLDINGDNESLSGWSVSMPNPNTVAIGAPINNTNGQYSGQTRVYIWDGINWVQNGIEINGDVNVGSGRSVSMPNTNTLAIGEPQQSGDGPGMVRIFENFPLLNSNEFDQSKNIIARLYPSPAKEVINIELRDKNIEINSIELFDLKGVIINKFNALSANSNLSIDISSLQSTTYIIKILTEEGIYYAKFIKH